MITSIKYRVGGSLDFGNFMGVGDSKPPPEIPKSLAGEGRVGSATLTTVGKADPLAKTLPYYDAWSSLHNLSIWLLPNYFSIINIPCKRP